MSTKVLIFCPAQSTAKHLFLPRLIKDKAIHQFASLQASLENKKEQFAALGVWYHGLGFRLFPHMKPTLDMFLKCVIYVPKKLQYIYHVWPIMSIHFGMQNCKLFQNNTPVIAAMLAFFGGSNSQKKPTLQPWTKARRWAKRIGLCLTCRHFQEKNKRNC